MEKSQKLLKLARKISDLSSSLPELSEQEYEMKKSNTLSKLTGMQGELGKLEGCCLKIEKKLAFGHTSASDFDLKASSDDANKTGKAERIFKRNVKPFSKISIWKEVILYFIDMFLDLAQIHNLYWNKCHAFGGAMLFLFTWVLTVQLVNRDLCTLSREMHEIARHGVKTEAYMRIMRWEKGFESALGLSFNAYAIHFSVTTAGSLVTSFAGMFFSIHAFAIYTFHKGYLKSKYNSLPVLGDQ